jgi:DNA-directed RNA polymerase specialized sigma24 family protein
VASGHGPEAACQPPTRGRHPSTDRRRTLATPVISGDPIEGVVTRSTLAEAFDRLGAADRETLALIAWDGLQPREAATVVGCSAATFAVRAYRARRRLAALLDSEDGSPAVDAQGGRT